MNPLAAALAFFDAINRHDVEKLAGLMTEDHVFVDSLGSTMRGRETMRAWLARLFRHVSGLSGLARTDLSEGSTVRRLAPREEPFAIGISGKLQPSGESLSTRA